MITVNVNHHHYFHPSDALNRINERLDKIMKTQAEHAAELAGVKTQLTKVAGEIVAKIDSLVAAIQAGGNITPEVQAEMDGVKTLAQQLDDIVPDPAPQP